MGLNILRRLKSPTLREDDKILVQRSVCENFVYEDNVSIFSAQLADTLEIYIEEAKR